MAKQILTGLDLLALPSLTTPKAGSIGFGAKSDGLYQKTGSEESKLATQSDIDTAINELEIGGVNLLSGLNREYYLNNTGASIVSIITKNFTFKRNSEYVISYDIKGSGQARFVVSLYSYPISTTSSDGQTGSDAGGALVFTLTNEWKRVWVKIKTANWSVEEYVKLINISARANSEVSIRDIMFVSGNKAFDWSPAPEDQVSDWSTTDVTSFSYIKNKPTQLSQFTDNIGVANHIANKANPHNVTTAQIGAVDLTTNQSIGGVKTFTSKVVIGTNTSPEYGLDLTDSGSTEHYSKHIRFGASNLSGKYGGGVIWKPKYTGYSKTTSEILSFNDGNYFRGGLVFLTNGVADHTTMASEKMRITGLGNVGIGTTSPAYKLDVSGTGRFTGNITASTGVNTPKVDFGNGFTIEPSGTELVFKYNGAIKQRMLSDGTILAVGGITALST